MGLNGCWHKQLQTLAVWLYAGRHMASGHQGDMLCDFSGATALHEWPTRNLNSEHTRNGSEQSDLKH